MTPAEGSVRIGTFARRPAPLVFASLAARRATGTLTIVEPDGATHHVYVVDGVAAKAELAERACLLGETLERWGVVSAPVVAEALARSESLGILLGECLVGCHGVDRAWVERALRAQVVARVGRLARLPPATSFLFSSGFDRLASKVEGGGVAGGGEPWASPRLDTMLALVRGAVDHRASFAILARVGGSLVEVSRDVAATFATAGEIRVLEALSARPWTEGALAAHLGAPRDVEQVVVALFLAGLARAVPSSQSTSTSGRAVRNAASSAEPNAPRL